MSQKTVEWLIGRLLTDEACRVRFVADPLGTLVAMRDRGFDLTRSEIAALVRTDRLLWNDAADRIDSHLQRCPLETE